MLKYKNILTADRLGVKLDIYKVIQDIVLTRNASINHPANHEE